MDFTRRADMVTPKREISRAIVYADVLNGEWGSSAWNTRVRDSSNSMAAHSGMRRLVDKLSHIAGSLTVTFATVSKHTSADGTDRAATIPDPGQGEGDGVRAGRAVAIGQLAAEIVARARAVRDESAIQQPHGEPASQGTKASACHADTTMSASTSKATSTEAMAIPVITEASSTQSTARRSTCR